MVRGETSDILVGGGVGFGYPFSEKKILALKVKKNNLACQRIKHSDYVKKGQTIMNGFSGHFFFNYA